MRVRDSYAGLRTPPATGARLGFALLAYMLAVTLITTLLPFRFEWPSEWRFLLSGEPVDTVANVLLFVPLGFLFRLARPDARSMPVLSAAAAGALLSTAIEAAQLFEAVRNSSLVDIAANTFGASVGAFTFQRVIAMPHVNGRLVGRLALELPLMGLVFLLVPLLWIDSLASQGERARILTTLMLGLFGAMLLGGMQRAYFGPVRAVKPRHTAFFAGAWFLAGAFPVGSWRPLTLLCGAVGTMILCGGIGALKRHDAANRRFEVPLLKRAAPVYGVYVALIVLFPLHGHVGDWHLAIGFPEATSQQVEILRVLEIAAAFTLVGYMVAELRGRTVSRYLDAIPRLAGWGIALTLLVEAIRGYDAMQGASIARGALTVAAAMYGGWLYYLQRAHVINVLAEVSGRDK